MSSFTDPLVLVALASERDGRGEFALYLPFSYDVGFLGSGETITVPAGFNTDLASIPWFARPFVPIAGRMAKPALLHDFLLETGDPRAHDVFAEALTVARVPSLTRCLVLLAVGIWNRHIPHQSR